MWLPERLEHFVGLAEDFPQAGMLYGPTLYWYSWAEERGMEPPVPGQVDFEGHLDMPVHTLIEPPVPLREFLLSGGACLPGICSLLVRRDAYERIGGFEPSFRGLYEDQVFLSKMALWHPVVVTDQVLDRYRQHSQSCCYRAIETGEYHPEDLHPARLRYLRWMLRYSREHRVASSDLAGTSPPGWPLPVIREFGSSQGCRQGLAAGGSQVLPGTSTTSSNRSIVESRAGSRPSHGAGQL